MIYFNIYKNFMFIKMGISEVSPFMVKIKKHNGYVVFSALLLIGILGFLGVHLFCPPRLSHYEIKTQL